MITSNKIVKYLVIPITFFVIAILSIAIVFHDGKLFGAADMYFHFKRIFELKESIQHLNFFPHYSFNYFHGSATMSMYPYLNIYPLSIMLIFFHNIIHVIYVYYAMMIFITMLISFYASLSFSKNIYISYIFAVIYSCSTTFLTTQLVQMDLGIVTAIAVGPLILFGTLDFIYRYDYIKLTVGMVLTIYSHVLSVFISIFLIASLLLFYKCKLDKKRLLKIVKSILLTVITTFPVWGYTFYYLVYNVNNIASPGKMTLRGYSFSEFFITIFNLGTNYLVSIFSFLAMVFSFFLIKKIKSDVKPLVYLSWFFLLFCSKIFPWFLTNYSVLSVLKIFQFTWRFSVITNILLSYIFAYITIQILFKRVDNKIIITVVIIICSILLGFAYQFTFLRYSNNYPYFNELYTSNEIKNDKIYIRIKNWNPQFKIRNNSELFNYLDSYSNLTTVDYSPKNALRNFSYVNKNFVQSTKTEQIIGKMSRNGYNSFSFDLKRKTSGVKLPIYSYKKENITVYIDGKKIKYKIFNGQLVINKINSGKHELKIYTPNKLNNFIDLFFVLLGWISIFLIYKKNKDDRSNIYVFFQKK